MNAVSDGTGSNEHTLLLFHDTRAPKLGWSVEFTCLIGSGSLLFNAFPTLFTPPTDLVTGVLQLEEDGLLLEITTD